MSGEEEDGRRLSRLEEVPGGPDTTEEILENGRGGTETTRIILTSRELGVTQDWEFSNF